MRKNTWGEKTRVWDRKSCEAEKCMFAAKKLQPFCTKVAKAHRLVSIKLCGFSDRKGKLGRSFWAKNHNSCAFWAINFGWSLERQGGPTRGSKIFNTIIQMEADCCAKTHIPPQRQGTLQAITYSDGPNSGSGKASQNRLFRSISLLINSINLTGWSKTLLRERCGKVKYWRLSYSAIVSISITLGNWFKTYHGVARSSDRLVNVAWVVLHCNCRIGAREWRQLIPHVRFQVRASSVVSGWTWCWGLNLKVLWLKAFLSGVGRYWVRRSFWCFATAKKSSTFRLLFFARGLSVTFTVFGWFCWTFLSKVEVCPLFAALRVFCHTQHICNMHATSGCAATFWQNPHNAVRDAKIWNVCEHCYILPWSTLDRRQNAATAFTLYSGAAPFLFARVAAWFQPQFQLDLCQSDILCLQCQRYDSY